jgi:hypothetical protein
VVRCPVGPPPVDRDRGPGPFGGFFGLFFFEKSGATDLSAC